MIKTKHCKHRLDKDHSCRGMKVSGLIILNEEFLAHLSEIKFSSTFPHNIPNNSITCHLNHFYSHISSRSRTPASSRHIFTHAFLILPAHTACLFLSWLPWHIAARLFSSHTVVCMFLSLLNCNNSYQHCTFVSISSCSHIHRHCVAHTKTVD